MSRTSLLAIVAVALLLAACAAPGASALPSDDEPGPSTSLPSSTEPSGSASRPPFQTAPPLPSGAIGGVPADVPDDVWSAILEDLGRRLDTLDTGDVELLTAEAVTWTDGSLGCPEPGQMYTQALVEGYRIIVEAGGAEYVYRIGSGASVRLCEQGFPGGG